MIKEGDLILLYRDSRRNYLIQAAKEDKFHTDRGYINTKDIVGKEFGSILHTNLGDTFYILKPTLYELMMKVNRNTQIIYPKDLGVILTKATVYPGARVIEVGIGSGAFTSAMAYFIRPDGKIYSYERRIDLLNNAIKNIKKNGLENYVEAKHKEVTDSFDEADIDFIMIDIGSPWMLIDAAYKALKPGYRIASICPTFEQLTKTVFALQEKGFTNVETLEILIRRILVRYGKTRPEQQIPSHTGFLVFASKVMKE